VAGNCDIEQVEYFWALLSEQRAAVREKLDRLHASLARSERGGHLSSVRRKRLLIRAMESDIRAIDRMCTRWETICRCRQSHCGTAVNA